MSPVVGAYVAGTAALEGGSLCYNLRVLYETPFFKYMYWIGITLSHIPAVGLGFWLVTMDVPLGLSITYLVIDVIVCYFRQVEVFRDAEVFGFKKKKKH